MPEGMYYCGPAVHTLFISCTRMAGDDDFIKSGKVGGWAEANWYPKCAYVHLFLVRFPIQYVHEFQYDMFSKRDGRRHEMGNQSPPLSL